MYSAIKIGGKKLYELARAGKEAERPARKITIFETALLDFTGEHATFRVRCSKGTYVRSICRDLGEQLGCGGCMDSLRRVRAGVYTEADTVTLEQLQANQKAAGESDSAQNPIDRWDLQGDATAKEILDTIFRATIWNNVPEAEFDSIEEAPNSFLLNAAYFQAPYIFWYQNGTEPNTIADFEVLTPLVNPILFWSKRRGRCLAMRCALCPKSRSTVIIQNTPWPTRPGIWADGTRISFCWTTPSRGIR